MIRLARFPPWLAVLGADGTCRFWRIQLRWDARIKLLEVTPAEIQLALGKRFARIQHNCLVFIDSSLPYRRRLHRYPSDSVARAALLRSAVDEFPLSAHEHAYALMPAPEQPEEGRLLAISLASLNPIHEAGLTPLAAYAVDSSANPDALADELQKLGRHHREADFLRKARLLPAGFLRLTGLAVSFIVLTTTIALLFSPQGWLTSLEKQRMAELRLKAGPALKHYQALQQISQQQAAVEAFQQRPESRLTIKLAELLSDLPSGYAVRSIEYQAGQLSLSGRGQGDGTPLLTWARQHKLPAEALRVESATDLLIFHLTLPL